jgi:phosphosulfolactate synthase
MEQRPSHMKISSITICKGSRKTMNHYKALTLPQHTDKPRNHGITCIHDVGIPLGELKNILHDFHSFIDVAKLGIGTAAVDPNIEAKIALYQSYDISVYCGGTLFEKYYHQSLLPEYKKWLLDLGLHHVEISSGSCEIPFAVQLDTVELFSDAFTIFAEVGSKDERKQLAVAEWIARTTAFLNAGSRYVIVEGRGSGTAGIYDCDGNIKLNIVDQLITHVDYKRIIFEAPSAPLRAYFINRLGANVNFGNVSPRDVLHVEAQRCALQFETFFLEEKSHKLPVGK